MAALSYENCSLVFGLREMLNLLPTVYFFRTLKSTQLHFTNYGPNYRKWKDDKHNNIIKPCNNICMMATQPFYTIPLNKFFHIHECHLVRRFSLLIRINMYSSKKMSVKFNLIHSTKNHWINFPRHIVPSNNEKYNYLSKWCIRI